MKRHVAIVATVGLFALTGCSSPITPDEVPSSGPVAFYPRASNGMDAQLIGVLSLTDTCLLVTADDGGTSLPVFPVGEAEWTDAGLVIGDETYAVGSEITLAGGEITNGMFGPSTYLPADCDRDATFFVAPE